MNYVYNPQKETILGSLAEIRPWSWDEPSGLASHPAYQFLISEKAQAYSFSVFSGCRNQEDWDKIQKHLGVTFEELIVAGRFGLSPGVGLRNVNMGSRPFQLGELTTLHIVPQSSRLLEKETNELLGEFEPRVFAEYQRRHSGLRKNSQEDFY